MIELPLNAQHWNTAESRAGAAAVWRRNPAGDVSIEKEKYILLGFGLTRNWFSLVDLWKERQVIAEGQRFSAIQGLITGS